MSSRPEVLVCGCHEDDLAVLRSASAAGGPVFCSVETPVQVAHRTVSRPPAAIVLGLEASTLSHLDVIPVIRAVRSDLPVIVIARKDSLDLERAARQKGVFYYLIHPLDVSEARAVLEDLERLSKG